MCYNSLLFSLKRGCVKNRLVADSFRFSNVRNFSVKGLNFNDRVLFASVLVCVIFTPLLSTAAVVQKPKVKQSRCEPAHIDSPQPILKRNSRYCDKDGFIKVERKKKPACRNQCGTVLTGPNHLLRPATPTTQLYVSRLHHSTKVTDIVEYVRVKTKLTLRVERLDSRHDVNFNSFVVRVPTDQLSTFTREEFWPKGVAYGRFRGRLSDTAKVPTSQTSRACN